MTKHTFEHVHTHFFYNKPLNFSSILFSENDPNLPILAFDMKKKMLVGVSAQYQAAWTASVSVSQRHSAQVHTEAHSCLRVVFLLWVDVLLKHKPFPRLM